MEASQGEQARAAGTPDQVPLGDRVTEILRGFHGALGDALDRGLTADQIVKLFSEVQTEARRLLEAVGDETGYGGGVIAGLALARDVEAILLNQHGWLEVAPGTMQAFAGAQGQTGWLAFQTTTTIETSDGFDLFDGKRLLVPLADVMGMRVPAEEEVEEGKVRVEQATCPRCGSPDVDLEFGGNIMEKIKCADCGTVYGTERGEVIEIGSLREGDRVSVRGGQTGEVVAGPDSEGKVPVQIDGGAVEVFVAAEVQPVVPEPCPFAEGDRVRTPAGWLGTVAAVPDPGKMVPVLPDGSEVPTPFGAAVLTKVEDEDATPAAPPTAGDDEGHAPESSEAPPPGGEAVGPEDAQP